MCVEEGRVRVDVIQSAGSIDLVTVFDAILTSRQTREKLQCLYENLMSNNLGVDKTRNIPEHAGTCRNIPEHEKIKVIFMKKN